jgi:hypothetical protein
MTTAKTKPAEPEQVSEPPVEIASEPANGQLRSYRVTTVERVTRYYAVQAKDRKEAEARIDGVLGGSGDDSLPDTGVELVGEELRGGHVHNVRWERDAG